MDAQPKLSSETMLKLDQGVVTLSVRGIEHLVLLAFEGRWGQELERKIFKYCREREWYELEHIRNLD
jgi:hypothetical protein